MKTKIRIATIAYWSAQFLWVGACVAVLVFYLRTRANATDADTVLGYAMIALSFPVSLADIVIHGWLGVVAGRQETGTVWAWIEMFVLGYLQWFVLFPLAIRAVKRRVSTRAKGQESGQGMGS